MIGQRVGAKHMRHQLCAALIEDDIDNEASSYVLSALPERYDDHEFEEILGYHLEQAHEYRRQLGPLDARAEDLGARAADVRPSLRAIAWTVAVLAVMTIVFDNLMIAAGLFEFADELPGYRIEYVDRPVRQCGSGDTVPLLGDAWLSLRFYPANAHTEEGQPTVLERQREQAQRLAELAK